VQFVSFVVFHVWSFVSLAPLRETRPKLRGRILKTVPKWDKACHTCSFPEEFGMRETVAPVPNRVKPVTFSVKPVPKVPDLALRKEKAE
jgi:hypothetical protein